MYFFVIGVINYPAGFPCSQVACVERTDQGLALRDRIEPLGPAPRKRIVLPFIAVLKNTQDSLPTCRLSIGPHFHSTKARTRKEGIRTTKTLMEFVFGIDVMKVGQL